MSTHTWSTGQEVVVHANRQWGHRPRSIDRVERVTKGGLPVVNGVTYRASGVGRGTSYGYIEPLTAALRATIAAENRLRKASDAWMVVEAAIQDCRDADILEQMATLANRLLKNGGAA